MTVPVRDIVNATTVSDDVHFTVSDTKAVGENWLIVRLVGNRKAAAADTKQVYDLDCRQPCEVFLTDKYIIEKVNKAPPLLDASTNVPEIKI